jgi:glycosyltransferase involved in cell wall biosynthesis
VSVKLAFIIQRYGREILGGAETLARQIAERLARRHDIEVLTTSARDYITWKNEYPPGEEKLRGIRIKRFPVESERNLDEFNRFSDWIYVNPHSREDELRWLEKQGPVVPELIEYLRKEHGRYELLVFFTYLYYPTYYGLQVDPQRSVLIPTAHDEPPLKLDIYKEMFSLPASFIFNTEAEELLVLERFGVYKKMRETIGIGMEQLDAPDVSKFRRKYKLPSRFLLYAGRIDAGKRCDELVRFFRFYKEERPDAGNLQLVLIGNLSMKLPPEKDIRYLGFLSEEDKMAAMTAATAVVVPSRLESLSIVALESFSVGTPILVSSDSRVLVDHCRRANAGLYYSDYDEFEAVLDLLLRDKNLMRTMGKQGRRYIKENFGWEELLSQYELAFRSSSRPPRPALYSMEERPKVAEKPTRAEKSPPPVETSAEEAISASDAPLPTDEASATESTVAEERTSTGEATEVDDSVQTEEVDESPESSPDEELSDRVDASTSKVTSGEETPEAKEVPTAAADPASEESKSERETRHPEEDRESAFVAGGPVAEELRAEEVSTDEESTSPEEPPKSQTAFESDTPSLAEPSPDAEAEKGTTG